VSVPSSEPVDLSAVWFDEGKMMLDDGEEWRSLVIDEEYLRRHTPAVRQRLQQAGIRLARLLNQSLTMEENQ
jgi:hypothetical protein